MNQSLRIYSSIVLLAVLFLPYLGAWAWTSWKQREVKTEVRALLAQQVSPSQLVLRRFSVQEAKDLLWEDTHEFEWRGEMHDVVRRETIGDSVTFWCFLDVEESHWKSERRRMVGLMLGGLPHQRRQQSFIAQMVKTLVPVTLTKWAQKLFANALIYPVPSPPNWVGRSPSPPFLPPEHLV